jgi:hypothetical protein
MRVWDIEPCRLCKNHLLGEHREIHAIWNILTMGRSGYANHPETKRWRGKLAALYLRHQADVVEMGKRGYKHTSELDKRLATGSTRQDIEINSLKEQEEILKDKNCKCQV